MFWWPPCLLALLLTGEAPTPTADPRPLGVPFQRYAVKDAFGRSITFYLSVPPKQRPDAKRPIVLLILGSGCPSVFRKVGEQVSGGYQNLLLQAAKERVRVLVVAKPGVRFLDAPARPGSAEGASAEFLKEHTLPRWAEANRTALRGTWTLLGVDASRALVVGHSEGGIVAARVAAEVPG